MASSKQVTRDPILLLLVGCTVTQHNLSIENILFLDGAIRVYRVPNSELVHAFLRTNLYCDGGNITCDAVWERNSILSIFQNLLPARNLLLVTCEARSA